MALVGKIGGGNSSPRLPFILCSLHFFLLLAILGVTWFKAQLPLGGTREREL